MVEISVEYLTGLRCKATHGPSGASLLTDAPVDNQGRGEAFSPTDLVATAFGCCMATVMGIVAERDGIDLSGVAVRVRKHMVADPERRIGRLEAEVRMPAHLNPVQRRKLEATARACPVRQSLRPEVDIELSFVYD
jgi:putative redox protein